MAACIAVVLGCASGLSAQTLSQRGFVEVAAIGFPQKAPNDAVQAMGDLIARDEVFVKPASWLQFAGGVEIRANSRDQVDDNWRIDFSDRGTRRPPFSIRRLSATISRRGLALDLGKQFVRWGTADIVNPTDRFAPQDVLNVTDPVFLAITAVRGTARFKNHTVEAVWGPRLTPSRIPLINQRWAALPPAVPVTAIVEQSPVFPTRSQSGARYRYVANTGEYSLSFFDGFNHFPDLQFRQRPPLLSLPPVIEMSRVYPRIRMYGADSAVPVRWFTVKAEAGYFTSPLRTTDEYLLYVVQIERQVGEWIFVAGYSGDAVSRRRSLVNFAPDRGLSRSLVSRIAYTIGPNRSVNFECAVHQNGGGAYGKIEYSQARGNHWRATVTAIGLGGRHDDFLGQYRKNSQLNLRARYSF
jgi:hypothetical protein